MNKKVAFLCLILFSSLCLLAGCSDSSDDEDTYVVWTDFSSYSDFKTAFNTTLNDGYYIRLDLTNSQFSEFSGLLNEQESAEYKHEWTQSQIKSWFIGCGFDNEGAEKESSWLATNYHGMIAIRNNDYVYYIIK